MRKLYQLTLVLVLACLYFTADCKAQRGQVAARAAEWKSYSLPSTEFTRTVDESAAAVFRVPTSWKPEGPPRATSQLTTYSFTGPHSTVLKISLKKIPDGWPLRDYLAAIMQGLRTAPSISDSLIVRRTELSGIEAREIMFELAEQNGHTTRRLIWCAVDGPRAIAIVLIEPEEHIAELEPYFRAVVQSVIVVDKEKYTSFADLRSRAIKESKPARVDEVQSIAATVNALDAAERDKAIARLASIFSSAPDRTLDLVIDPRPMVRAAAIEAIARSRNHALDPFLLKALHDPEAFVSARAGRAVASMPNVVEALRNESFDWFNTEQIARVWSFLDKPKRLQVLSEMIGAADKSAPIQRSRMRSRSGTAAAEKTNAFDPSRELGLLTLLGDLPGVDFKLPFAQVLLANNDALTSAALQVAEARRERLPVPELFKLLSSSSPEVQQLAAANLAESAAIENIAQIEDLAKRISESKDAPPQGDAAKRRNLAEQLHATVKKIRLRQQLSAAPVDQRQQLLKPALADPQLADWAWTRFVNETAQPDSRSEAGKQISAAQISPLGENVFPEAVTLYAAIPDPSKTFRKLSDSLNGIQMDSASAQANLVLVLNGLHKELEQQLGVQTETAIFDYSGIKLAAPIAFAVWTANGAPASIAGAQRKAIILRVADRYRFERTLALYQEKIGSFAWLPESVSLGARFLAALPAILPVSAEMLLRDVPSEEKEPILSYDFVGETELEGQPVKVIAQRRVSPQGVITNDAVYLLYIGEAAVLAPDLDSLSDVLRRVRAGGPTLAINEEFKRAREAGGDVVYLSSIDTLFRAPGDVGPRVNETGALTISDTLWESSFHLTFKESNWSKPLVGFQPDELIAPRELLPRSTVAYYFMKLDPRAAWQDWGKELLGATELKKFASAWTIDVEKEVLPNLDAECGVALLGLPDASAKDWNAPWIAFFQLKGDQLQRSLDEGHLFKDGVAHQGITRLNFDSGNLFVTIRHGFLLVSGREDSFAVLDQNEKLAASRDFAKAAKHTPSTVVAFGGYNLEATGTTRGTTSDSVKAQQANLIRSLTRAFHSPSLYAAASAGSIDARSSISMDREGRYSVAELQSLAANSEPAFAVLEPTGLPIANQDRLKSLKLRIHTKAAGEVERIAEDVASNSQTIEQRSDQDLQVRVLARRAEPKQPLQLPVTAADFAPFLRSTSDIPAGDKTVSDKAREIAGADRDAWSVARKLADWTYKNLKWKQVDDANAAQTLATREADCYEFSKLYVAMARSLGLPARIVSGLAYSGSSFGGHAWVEVYAGSWFEIDPTWGTDFVDATHVRDSSGALITYAALSLVQLEVMEAPRRVDDFQLDAGALVKRLCEELDDGRTTALNTALDVAVLTDELMGQGTWTGLTDAERDRVSAAYQRLPGQISAWLKPDKDSGGAMRVLSVKVGGDRAQALLGVTEPESLVKISLVRRDGPWLITEITVPDTALRFMAEYLQPSIRDVLERRNGQKKNSDRTSDFLRVLLAINHDPNEAIRVADEALKSNPKDPRLRYLKSLALSGAERSEEAVKLWTELSEEKPPLAQAVLSLAQYYRNTKEEADRKKAVELYARYFELEPDDPRAHSGAASLYDDIGNYSQAEKEYRAAIERDSSNADLFLDLAEFYARRQRIAEAVTTIDEATKRNSAKNDLFALLLARFIFDEQTEIPEALATSQPERMARSLEANLNLARIRLNHEHPREALPLLKRAVLLDGKSSDPYDEMAKAYRKLREWTAALNAADTAIRLNQEDADAHYERACALSRMGRRNEAMSSLKRALELDDSVAGLLDEEDDLKPLATLPAFKKMIAERDKP